MALTRPRYSQIPDTDWKQSVRVATTEDVGNVMLAAMPSTVDGITLNFYDRVLLKSQANAAQNGIYYVKAVGTGANGIWERTKDASSGGALGAVTPSIVTQVEEGTINKNRTFKLTTTGNIDLGTTDLSFGVQAAEPAGATGQLQFANVNNVIGGATTTSYDYVTGNLVLTGNVNTTLLYQNGKRVPQVFTSATPPATPAVGDQWYQVGTDILYEWLQDGSTAYWIDISGATIANINPITGENIGTLVVNGGNESTSTNTGALQVVGGVGITGNLNVGGSVSFGGGQLGSDLVISSNTTSTSETTGAIRIASPGGIGIGGNIWAGGAIVANSRIPSTSIITGAIVVPGTGGLGVGGNVFVGQNLTVAGNVTGGGVRQTISSGAPASPVVGDQWYQLGTDILYQYVSDGTGSYWVDIAGATVANISPQSQQSLTDIQIVSGTPSTSTSTGALTVSGGVGIQGNLNLQGGFNISGGNIVANQNVTSIDTTTGSMVVTGQGGLGVGGNINAGGNLIVAQAASFLQNVIISANLVAGGTYFAAGGLSVTNGNVVASGTNAQIGGLTITSGAISGLSNLGVTGNITLGGALVATGDISTTGNITGGGLRKYAQVNSPVSPIVGDVWYKTDTDVYYTYVNDGTNKYWIDYTSATVANISPQTNQTLSDIVIVSGTPATNTTTGALQVQGGAGITGNVFAGNLSTATISATNFTYANGVSILEGNQGTYSNANVTAYLAVNNISVGGNLTASGTYFSAAGLSVTAGNIVASGASAVIGGLTIENGGISSLASLNVIGSGTLGGDFAVTGNITGGGLRKYAQAGAPANPILGDVWYKTDTDVFYQYVNDGTSKYWIDYTSATVSNANPTSPQSLQDLQIVSGTPSTGSGTGALQVTGGAAVTGNVFTGNLSTATIAASNFTYANGVSILLGNEGTYSNANVTAYLTARNVTIADGNITATGGYLAAGGFIATAGNIRTTSANIGGVIIESGGIGQLASLGVVGAATIGGDVAITGNITAGGLRKYAQAGAPANPVVGDVWYKTDTDVYYQYINDGTSKYWVDYSSATVSNASPTTSQSLQDLQIVSGTASTSTSTGALVVQGGIGASGNVFTGNLSTGTVAAINFTYANGVSILVGNEGTYSNANVTAYLTARNVTIADGNITATGSYLAAGGFTAVAGNIRTTSANIGGVIIELGGIGSLASLNVIGGATIGADLAVTGNITGGGIRKSQSTTAPVNPVVGDLWYKTDTDVYYQYTSDGTNKYWIDYVGATVSNAAVSASTNNDYRVASGTASIDTNTGALTVVGGVGITGNVNAGNVISTSFRSDNFLFANGSALADRITGTFSNANVAAYLTTGTVNAGNITVTGTLSAPGIRKTTSASAPASPVVGDLWYKTDTDVLYQYINDGANNYWVDYVGPTVSNASITSSQIAYDIVVTTDTQSTSTTTGAIRVQGGIGLIGNIFTTGIADIGGNLRAGNITANNNVQTNTLQVIGDTNVNKLTAVGNITSSGTYFSAGGLSVTNGNLVATGTTATIGGLTITDGGLGSLASLDVIGLSMFGGNVNITESVNVTKDIIATGNITGGGLRKYAQDSAPANPVVGDVWYKTDTDVFYQYVNDGTNRYWIDYTSATVSNASPVTAQSLQNLEIVSVTPSTSTTTGAIIVAGGVGVAGNINAGNVSATNVSAGLFTYANGVSILEGNQGTYSNANVTAYLTARTTTISDGFLSTAGMTVTAGNLRTTSANIGGVIIESGGIGSLASLNVIGGAIIGGDVAITGNVTGGGIRKTTSSSAPVNPVVGDLWYKTDTDVLYQYINDGSGTYWVDYVGATVSNAAVTAGTATDYAFTSGTPSTSPATGAVVVTGGIGLTGDLFTTGLANFGGNVTVNNLTSNLNIQASTMAVVGNLTTGNLVTGIATIARADIAGALTVGSDVTITGNVTGGGIRKTTSISAPVNPTVGDQWYKTDSDVLYQYINDGTNSYWIDYAGATVSNAVVENSTNVDTTITSGTESTNTTSGALTIVGGIGVTGNINAGNVIATSFRSDNFSFANGRTLADRITGTYSNTNVAAYLTGNITVGNIATTDITSRDITARNVTLSGNITGGGLRKYAQAGAPANPILGDVWYKTDTDVYYQYINDGANYFWVDYVGPTVSNAAVQNGTNSDFAIASGTLGTSPVTGALVVTGGVGVTGNIYTTGIVDIGGNLRADNVTANNNLQTNTLAVVQNATVSGTLTVTGAVATGNLATGNITGYGFTTNAGNLTATGAYLSAGGISATSGVLSVGNIISSGTRAVVGGLTIENGAFGGVASLAVIAGATIGADLAVTGNVTGGGLRKYAQDSAPANPIVGDVWYKTDTDVFYQYVNDGTNKYWVDYVGPTVSNASITSSQIAYDIVVTTDTPSTSTTTGAVRVQGGIGLIGNIFTTGIADFGGNLTASNVTANNNTQTNTLAVINNATVGGTLNVTSALSSATLSTGNSSVGNIAGYGFTTNAGNLTATGAYFAAGGMSSTAGNITGTGFNITGGNIITTGARAVVGGLEIINGGFTNLASLGVVGSATIGADLAVTGNITGGGLRKTQSTTPPANPVQGDVWYKTDTDVYYQYINDGTASYWIDYVSATVANITQNAATVSDLQIVSGTPSTSAVTGALTVAGGVGVSGNIHASGNLVAGNVTTTGTAVVQSLISNSAIIGASLEVQGNIIANGFTVLNGAVTAFSDLATSGNLLAVGLASVGGNLTASGSYFSAGGLQALNGNITGQDFSITSGNITAYGQRAELGGLVIENGAFANIASLGVIGSATIGGDLAITGNITAGGLRKYAQTNAPASPVVGDVWYKTDTDVYYQYITDGTANIWVDFVSATVANITAANSQYGADVGFVSGTLSTSPQTGAVTVIGGVGITGNINTTGQITAAQQVQVQNLVSNTSIAGATLSIAGDITAYGFSTNNGNVTTTGKLTVGGLSVVPGNLSATGSYLSVNGFTALNGNITATGTTATIGGLTIENGGFGSVASIDVIGSAIIGGNVTITGNITGGGIRKTTGLTAPVNPTIGDQWYKTDTDILYQFMDDGTSTYWVDFASATVANITNDFDGLGDFQTIGNVIGNGIVSDNYYYANGVSFVTTTVANTQNIVANITNGFNLGLDLTSTGVTAGNYGSATSIPTVVVDNKGRVTSITSNAVSTTFGLVGNIGTSSINGGNTLVVVGVPNQISTTVAGNTISIGFTPNISFTDFTVNGNLIYQGGGIKTTTSPTPPLGPVNGDMWYQSGTDILYRYIFDGTNEYWIDLFSTPLRAVLPSQDIAGGDGEVQYNDNGAFGANANFSYDQVNSVLKVPRLRVTQTQSPATPGSTGLVGEITWDGEWVYVCVAPNTWRRAGLYAW